VRDLFIGLMSGTSLDGVDAALVDLAPPRPALVHTATTAALEMDPDWVEATAFAWLAKQTLNGRPGNLAAVTGAGGSRVLGANYPA
jgi:1,6-anhydro-N-acetylmuramate kinase